MKIRCFDKPNEDKVQRWRYVSIYMREIWLLQVFNVVLLDLDFFKTNLYVVYTSEVACFVFFGSSA